jgi:hypothetical protein
LSYYPAAAKGCVNNRQMQAAVIAERFSVLEGRDPSASPQDDIETQASR